MLEGAQGVLCFVGCDLAVPVLVAFVPVHTVTRTVHVVERAVHVSEVCKVVRFAMNVVDHIEMFGGGVVEEMLRHEAVNVVTVAFVSTPVHSKVDEGGACTTGPLRGVFRADKAIFTDIVVRASVEADALGG